MKQPTIREKIYSTLREASPALLLLKDDFFIIGASALILLEINIANTFDIDILTSKRDAKELEILWSQKILDNHIPSDSDLFRSTFSRFKFCELDIEVMGGLEVNKNGAWTQLVVQDYNILSIGEIEFKVPTLEEQMKILIFFGRKKDFQKLELIRGEMPRFKLKELDKYTYSIEIPIRITDINYGRHLGNDSMISILHEARFRFVQQIGFIDELEAGMILQDLCVQFKAETFYNDKLTVHIGIDEISNHSCRIYYKVTNMEMKIAALAETGIVFIDYATKKLCSVPDKIIHYQNSNDL